jgi:uncharacterized protein YxeA
MKFFLKVTTTLLLLIISVSALAYFFWYKPKFNTKAANFAVSVKEKDNSKKIFARLKQKAEDMAMFAKDNGYNTQYCFMVDMKIESGKKRFFVYNLLKDSVELSGLVTHGSGKTNTGKIQFSNTANSLCTSVGKYKIGNSYTGKFGLAFKLYGLDETNSNAFNRFVVLHSHSCVPNAETAPFPICESWGCPTVSPTFLGELKKYIEQSDNPVLLKIYH